ncbi:MAG: hypothetical protein L0177_02250 [Chloroflexi bacterium]|nr:hypothetical protein [Chloroflexota bacterium]
MQVSDLRELIAGVLRGDSVCENALAEARASIDAMRREASRHGLTEAEALKALLSPLFQDRGGCACSACVARRQRAGSLYQRYKSSKVSSKATPDL